VLVAVAGIWITHGRETLKPSKPKPESSKPSSKPQGFNTWFHTMSLAIVAIAVLFAHISKGASTPDLSSNQLTVRTNDAEFSSFQAEFLENAGVTMLKQIDIDDRALPTIPRNMHVQEIGKLIGPIRRIKSSKPLTLRFETHEKFDVSHIRILHLPEGGSEWQMLEPTSVTSEGVTFYAAEFSDFAPVLLSLEETLTTALMAVVVEKFTEFINVFIPKGDEIAKTILNLPAEDLYFGMLASVVVGGVFTIIAMNEDRATMEKWSTFLNDGQKAPVYYSDVKHTKKIVDEASLSRHLPDDIFGKLLDSNLYNTEVKAGLEEKI